MTDDTRLREAAERHAQATHDYRLVHDSNGDDHIETGRAWDRMRRTENELRATLAASESGGWGALRTGCDHTRVPGPAANARLIAAAPDMAELLLRLIADDVQPDESVWPWQQDARALLERVEGSDD